MKDKRKVAIIGVGTVGATVAYTLSLKNIVSDIVLVDINEDKSEGEKLDILHGQAYYNESVNIKVGKYRECRDADIVVIATGSLNNQKARTRLDLAEKDSKIAKEVTEKVVKAGFKGIFVVVSNPVDVITYVVRKVSRFPDNKVIGIGTMLDTSRFKYLLGELTNTSPKSIQGYILGEHGDSCLPIWSNCYIAGKQIFDYIEENHLSLEELNKVYMTTKMSGSIVSSKKQATYYAVSMCAVRIIQAIYQNENIVFPVSTYLNGEYDTRDICIGVPAIINSDGASEIVQLKLTRTERAKFENSVNVLKNVVKDLEI